MSREDWDQFERDTRERERWMEREARRADYEARALTIFAAFIILRWLLFVSAFTGTAAMIAFLACV